MAAIAAIKTDGATALKELKNVSGSSAVQSKHHHSGWVRTDEHEQREGVQNPATEKLRSTEQTVREGASRGGPVIDPDGDVVVRIARGDQEAVRALVDRHLNKMIAVGRRMLGSQDDAEEIAQEVFVKVWTHAGKWQPGKARFETWMHRVAVNLCYDRLRRKRETLMENLPERVDDSPGPAQSLQNAQVSAQVDHALQALPDRQRTAIILCHYQGLTNIEAAEIMDISIEAIESLLARARRGLRAKLKEHRDNIMGSV